MPSYVCKDAMLDSVCHLRHVYCVHESLLRLIQYLCCLASVQKTWFRRPYMATNICWSLPTTSMLLCVLYALLAILTVSSLKNHLSWPPVHVTVEFLVESFLRCDADGGCKAGWQGSPQWLQGGETSRHVHSPAHAKQRQTPVAVFLSHKSVCAIICFPMTGIPPQSLLHGLQSSASM